MNHQDVLEEYRHVVASMVGDQDKFDAPMVRLWTALAEAEAELVSIRKWANGLVGKKNWSPLWPGKATRAE